MHRTIEFLEATAKALPNLQIKRSGVAVCWISLLCRFDYMEVIGNATKTMTRDECAKRFEENQNNA